MARRGRGPLPHPDVLTPAQWAILDAWRHGMTRAVIAPRRGVSVIPAGGEEKWRPSSVLYFLVPDIGQAHREVTERGVKFQGAPHRIYKDDTTGVEDWMAFFDDPDGNMLAIMAHVSPDAEAAS